MKCNYCNKEVKIWWVHDGKWCCDECKRKFNKNLSLDNVYTSI